MSLYLKHLQIWVIIVFLIFIFSLPVFGDNPTKTVQFKNITIDTLGNQIYDSQKNIITNMSHARLVLDNVIIETDSLIYYGNQSLLVLNGNIMVMKNDITVKAKHLTLNLKTGWLDASGSVEMENPNESFQMESFHYNLNQDTGEGGPSIQGVVKGKDKDFYVTGKTAKFDGGTVIISPAGITRCPRKDFSDYIFAGKRMVIQGRHVFMEKVILKIMGIPVFYLPHMPLRGESLPHINLSANQGSQPDLNDIITKAKLDDQDSNSNGQSDQGSQSNKPETETPSPTSAPAPKLPKLNKVHVSPRFSGEISTTDKPSEVSVGRIFDWNLFSDEVDVNFDSEGIFSINDIYQLDLNQYTLAIDGKTDLNSHPKRELGVTFTKKAWQTDFGNWQFSLFSRMLHEETSESTYDGIDGGYRLDYQLTPDFNLSYLYIQDLSGNAHDWENLEKRFLLIDDYRLGGNLIYGMKIPLNPHYFIYNNGTYNFRYDEWVSQIVGIAREVDCIRIGGGWDFARNYIDLTFRLNY